MASLHGNLGGILSALGDLAGARQHAEEAQRIRQAAPSPDHPDGAESHDIPG